MLIVQVNNKNIEKSLKELKGKVIKTKQNAILFDLKEFTKPSITKREENKKAVYIQKVKSNKEVFLSTNSNFCNCFDCYCRSRWFTTT